MAPNQTLQRRALAPVVLDGSPELVLQEVHPGCGDGDAIDLLLDPESVSRQQFLALKYGLPVSLAALHQILTSSDGPLPALKPHERG